jgi:surface antigen
MRILSSFTAAVVMVSLLGGCSGGSDRRLDNTAVGTGAGVVLGGVVGNQFGRGSGKVLGTVVGAVAGGLIGNSIGQKLDQRDRVLAQDAEFDALERGESNRPRRWTNPENGRYGDFVPTAPYQRAGLDCRDYTHTIYVDGRPETMRGTACRNRDGTWSAAA